MTTPNRLRLLSLCAGSILFCALWQRGEAQQKFPEADPSKLELQVTQLSPVLYLIQGSEDRKAMVGTPEGILIGELFSGANATVCIGPDGLVMGDTKYASLKSDFQAMLRKLGAKSVIPRFVINTHIHDDHVGGNKAFDKKDTTVIAHSNVRAGLASGKNLPKWPLDEKYWPNLTFDHSLTLHINEEQIRVVHYPGGHSDGDAVIFFTKANVVQMGDLFFNGFLPIVDLDNGGNYFRYTAVVESIYMQVDDNTRIIPGHGPLANKKDLGNYLRLLHDAGTLVKRKMEQGLSLDEIKKEGLSSEWRSWNWSNVNDARMIEIIYKSASSS